MKTAGFLPQRWRTDEAATRHAAGISSVLETPPIAPQRDGLALFSMVGAAEVLPYLVAVKSLWRQLRRGRVVVLDDGSLTAQDRTILAHHCGDPEILHVGQVQRGPFPAGAKWERLLTVLDRRQSEYWVQLDSHTVTLGPVPEVTAALSRNRSFMLSDSGGFNGFSASGRSLAADFLSGAATVSGAGAEQVASGDEATRLLLARDSSVVVLPADRYLEHMGQERAESAALLHFPQPSRYEGEAYAAASDAALQLLHAKTG